LKSAVVFELPERLVEVAHFIVPRVQTWGRRDDRQYKEQVCELASISPDVGDHFEWFVFCIRCIVGESRGRWARQIPDVENIPKLIVDAFTGLLYPDDNLNHVRGVQVEADWGPDDQERAEVWIFGLPKRGENSPSGI
jgi:Holliday junction resolvase RusA-like endonuclease